MSPTPPGVEEVHDRLLDRILTGVYPVDSRLPSCRALAAELGSNSSTVDRAIGRLAASGRVRTVPRRGAYVRSFDGDEPDARTVVTERLEELLLRARRLGLTGDELNEVVGTVLERVESVRRVALVECNERDLRHLQDLMQRAIDVEVQPVLIEDAAGRLLDQEFDAVVSPIFHLKDVAPLVSDISQVVELNLAASPTTLRQLVEVRDEERLVVAAPSARGIQWMTAVVGQYFPGQIDGVQVGTDDLSLLDDAPVVVVNNAARVPDEVLAGVERLITLEWELDPRFVPTLRAHIERVLSARRAAEDDRTLATSGGHP